MNTTRSNTTEKSGNPWAFSSLPLLPREAEPLSASIEVEKFVAIAKQYDELDLYSKEKHAVLVAAYYLRSPWSDTELARLVKERYEVGYAEKQTLGDLMVALNVDDTNASQGRQKPGKRQPRR
jgi:hypothetical protein